MPMNVYSVLPDTRYNILIPHKVKKAVTAPLIGQTQQVPADGSNVQSPACCCSQEHLGTTSSDLRRGRRGSQGGQDTRVNEVRAGNGGNEGPQGHLGCRENPEITGNVKQSPEPASTVRTAQRFHPNVNFYHHKCQM